MILASATPVSVTLSLAAAVAYAIPAALASRLGSQATRMVLLLAWVLHGVVLTQGLLDHTTWLPIILGNRQLAFRQFMLC